MTTKNTGGSAFPSFTEAWDNDTLGMTLRDYLAAKAMQACLSDYESCKALFHRAERRNISFSSEVAEQAYDMADAMLKERNK